MKVIEIHRCVEYAFNVDDETDVNDFINNVQFDNTVLIENIIDESFTYDVKTIIADEVKTNEV